MVLFSFLRAASAWGSPLCVSPSALYALCTAEIITKTITRRRRKALCHQGFCGLFAITKQSQIGSDRVHDHAGRMHSLLTEFHIAALCDGGVGVPQYL